MKTKTQLFLFISVLLAVNSALADNYQFRTVSNPAKIGDRRLSENIVAAPPHNTRVLENGTGSLQARINMIRRTQHRLDVETFDFKFNESGLILIKEMMKRSDQLAAEGKPRPKFNILVDQSLIIVDTTLRPEAVESVAHYADIVKELNARGDIEIRKYQPGKWSSKRNHRKVWIKDPGTNHAELITGGRNVGNEYFDVDNKDNYVDRDIQVWTGQHPSPLITELWKTNQDFWRSSNADEIRKKPRKYGRTGQLHRKKMATRKFPDREKAIRNALFGYDPKFAEFQNYVEQIGTQQLATYGVHSCEDLEYFTDGPNNGIRRSHAGINQFVIDTQFSLVNQTPYMSQTDFTTKAYRHLGEIGVNSIIVTNSVASSDFPEVFPAHQRFIEKLSGSSRVFALNPHVNPICDTNFDRVPQFNSLIHDLGKIKDEVEGRKWNLHAKTLVRDDKDVFIGSYNFDVQAAKNNAEVVLICRNSPALAAEVKNNIFKFTAEPVSYELDRAGRHPRGFYFGGNSETARRFNKGKTLEPLVKGFITSEPEIGPAPVPSFTRPQQGQNLFIQEAPRVKRTYTYQ